MEITETERLMLVKKKEEICGLTLWIIDNANDQQNAVGIKKNVTMILSLLNTIASYADSKNCDMDSLKEIADTIFFDLNQLLELTNNEQNQEHVKKATQEKIQTLKSNIVYGAELFSNYANSVRFDFTKKGFRIVLPKNINLGNITNK
jgi:hypothetical protein